MRQGICLGNVRAARAFERRYDLNRIGQPIDRGIVRPGMLADLMIVDENPIHNIKVLYGTGAVKLNDETGRPERIGGVRWTIKDGIVYDAPVGTRLAAGEAVTIRTPTGGGYGRAPDGAD